MNPNACYRDIVEAIQNGDYATARARAKDLKEWLDGGGFYPLDYTKAEVDACLADLLRRTCGEAEE